MQFDNQGSICTFTPVDAKEKKWVEDNLSIEPWQWQGGSLVVDHRMAHDIVDFMQEQGIEVQSS
jgi:hypothetical protein